MRKQFVKTENYSRFTTGIQAVEQRGAAEAGMMLVHGAPGYGKSHIVGHWAAESRAVFLRANVDWTPKYFLVELAKVLRVDPTGTAQQLFSRLLERVVEAQTPIVIDEAEFTLHNGAAALEKVRDLSDRAEVTVVLIGMERIQQSIARHKQIASRIAQVVEFGASTLPDVEHACGQLSEVAMSPALMAEVHRISGGRMREVLNVIAAVERIAAINGQDSLDVADLDGAALSYDWQTRTPKAVRQARGR
ncbi:AAA family ATPase [Fundidesulfovibrio agrisoli]|uniref:AAA family ATPase n=1 Tax=Fundidesulfovibrio agrisoli TaxID=2922717 RepID=UPI001FAB3F95|nr:ATP-binding protein [Fundidesulfovibrio agrisoli]